MKKFLAITLFALLIAGCNTTTTNHYGKTAQDGDAEQDDNAYQVAPNQTVIWIGPGWYYGFWFDTQAAFFTWQRYHYYRGHRHGNFHHHHGRNHGSRHGGHRSGGHRSSGHRSGGHRGGGGHHH